MDKQISRLINYINTLPKSELWIISDNNIAAKICERSLKEYIPAHTKTRIIDKKLLETDGMNEYSAIIVLDNRWFKNPLAKHPRFQDFLRNSAWQVALADLPEPDIFKDSMEIKYSGIEKIQLNPKDILVIQLAAMFTESDKEKMTEKFESKLGCKVMLLNPGSEIVGIIEQK